jgi:hypothetical protein
MSKEQVVQAVAVRLIESAGKLSYGTVSAILTVHEGRVVVVCHEIKETIRERKEVKHDPIC